MSNMNQDSGWIEGGARRPRRFYYPGSVIFPVVLVALGVVLLLRNTGALAGDTWNVILNLWPVLLIALGLDSLLRRSGVVGPVFWIGLGTVFLMSNFGVIKLDVWDAILSLWPLLLLAIGLDLLVARRSLILSFVAVAALLAVMVAAVWYMNSRQGLALGFSGTPLQQSLNEAKLADVHLKPPLGKVDIKAIPLTDSSDALVSGQVRQGAGQSVKTVYTVNNGVGDYTLQGEGVYFMSSMAGPAWNIGLSSRIPITVNVDTGMGSLTLDLTGLQIGGLKVNSGLGSSKVILPAQGNFSGSINGAMGNITIIVPKGAALRITTGTALVAIQAPQDFKVAEKVYTSPGFTGSGDYIDLHVGLAMGTVTVQYAELQTGR